MEGNHKQNRQNKGPIGKGEGNAQDDELLSEETLYAWRKKAAIEIQFLTKTKKEFYELYLRNNN